MNKVFGPFLVHFPNFWDKKVIQENPTLSHTTLAPYKNLEKTNDAIPRKRLDRRTDGRTDRPYFIAHFRLLPGVQKRLCSFKYENSSSHSIKKQG